MTGAREVRTYTQTASGATLDMALANAKMLAAFYSRKREQDLSQTKYSVLEVGVADGKSFTRVEATYRTS